MTIFDINLTPEALAEATRRHDRSLVYCTKPRTQHGDGISAGPVPATWVPTNHVLSTPRCDSCFDPNEPICTGSCDWNHDHPDGWVRIPAGTTKGDISDVVDAIMEGVAS